MIFRLTLHPETDALRPSPMLFWQPLRLRFAPLPLPISSRGYCLETSIRDHLAIPWVRYSRPGIHEAYVWRLSSVIVSQAPVSRFDKPFPSEANSLRPSSMISLQSTMSKQVKPCGPEANALMPSSMTLWQLLRLRFVTPLSSKGECLDGFIGDQLATIRGPDLSSNGIHGDCLEALIGDMLAICEVEIRQAWHPKANTLMPSSMILALALRSRILKPWHPMANALMPSSRMFCRVRGTDSSNPGILTLMS